MANYTIPWAAAPYYTVRVEFGEQAFEQMLVSIKTGAELEAQFQAYADQYETDWNAMQPAVEPEPEPEPEE
jgi:hypothetical protein